MENLLKKATVKTVVMKANPQSAAGSSVLCYSHFQAALCDELVENLAAFAALVVDGRVLFLRWGNSETSNVWRYLAESYWHCRLPPIRQEAGRLLSALGPVRRSSFRRSRDRLAFSITGLRRGLHHSLI